MPPIDLAAVPTAELEAELRRRQIEAASVRDCPDCYRGWRLVDRWFHTCETCNGTGKRKAVMQ